MRIILSGHHLDITDALRNYVSEKFARVERHFDHASQAQVVLSVEKLRHKAEASLHLAGNEIFANSVADDMYAAIDNLVDKIDRQVKKHKEKITDKHRADKPRSYEA